MCVPRLRLSLFPIRSDAHYTCVFFFQARRESTPFTLVHVFIVQRFTTFAIMFHCMPMPKAHVPCMSKSCSSENAVFSVWPTLQLFWSCRMRKDHRFVVGCSCACVWRVWVAAIEIDLNGLYYRIKTIKFTDNCFHNFIASRIAHAQTDLYTHPVRASGIFELQPNSISFIIHINPPRSSGSHAHHPHPSGLHRNPCPCHTCWERHQSIFLHSRSWRSSTTSLLAIFYHGFLCDCFLRAAPLLTTGGVCQPRNSCTPRSTFLRFEYEKFRLLMPRYGNSEEVAPASASAAPTTNGKKTTRI